MKKILLSAIALMGMVSASAQEATTPYILSQVEALTVEMEDASISLMDFLVKYQK